MNVALNFRGRIRDHRRRRGGALLMVLGVIIVLSLAVFSLFEILMPGLSTSAVNLQIMRAVELAESGIALAAHPLIEADDPLLSQQLKSGEQLDVEVRSEGGKLNLNYLALNQHSETLLRLFFSWGMESNQATVLVDRIFDWIDADDLARLNGMEQSGYLDDGLSVQPINRPLHELAELDSLPGIEVLTGLRPDWRESFTLWSDGPLDLNAAAPELIVAVTGVFDEQVDPLMRLRLGDDGIENTPDDYLFGTVAEAIKVLQIPAERLPLVSSHVSIRDSTVRISSQATVRDVSRRVEVVLRNQGTEPVLLRREVKGGDRE